MPKSSSIEELEAQHGERMIELKVRFWTNNIAEEPGKIVPKYAWASGVIHIERNRAHGIVPKQPMPFHTLLDLTAVIEKTLVMYDIRLHTSRRMKQYFSDRQRTAGKRGQRRRKT